MCTTKNLHERKNNKEKLISQEREMVYLNAGFGQQCSFTTSAHTTIRCCYQTIQKSKYINCGLEENSRFVTSPHDRKMNSRQWLVKQRAAAKIQCFNYQLHPQKLFLFFCKCNMQFAFMQHIMKSICFFVVSLLHSILTLNKIKRR